MSGSINPQLLAAIMAALGGPTQPPSGAPSLARAALAPVAAQGRNGDNMLAHVNPEEAALLKQRGGAGTINPQTGLPEFFEGGTGGDIGGGGEKGAAGGFDGGTGGSGQGGGAFNQPDKHVGPGLYDTNLNVAMSPTAEKLGSAAPQTSTGPGVDRGTLGNLVQGYRDMSPPLGSVPGIMGALASLLGGGGPMTAAKGVGLGVQALGGSPQTLAQKDAQTQAAMTAGGGGAGVAGGEGVYIDPVLRQAMLYAGQQG